MRKRVGGSGGESERLGESAGEELGHLHEVVAVADLPVAGEPTGEVVVKRVEARQLVQFDAFVKNRVWLATEHLDGVAEVNQRLG